MSSSIPAEGGVQDGRERVFTPPSTTVDRFFVLDFYSALLPRPAGLSGGHVGTRGVQTRARSSVSGAGAGSSRLPSSLLVILFLTTLGIVATSICYLANVGIYYMVEARAAIVGPVTKLSPALGCVAFVGLSVAAALASGCIVKYFAPAAAGSGIPEMKSHLSGVVHAGFLSGSTLLGKFGGLMTAQAAGLSIGKEGPFVHLAAASTAGLLRNVPLFGSLYASGPLRIQLLAAAVAVGVAATFGAAVGGVLFSVEVTATYYFVDNLPKAYYAAVMGLFFVRALAEVPAIDVYSNLALFSTDIQQLPYSFPEFVAYALVGAVSGLMGAAFVYLVSRVIYYRARVPWLGRSMPLTSIAVVASVSATVTWFLNRLLHEDEKTNIERLVSHDEIESLNHKLFDLSIYIPIKFALTVAAVVLPIPSGVFSPVFAYGAAFGRLVGEIMAHMFPSLNVAAGGYAIVGAAAMTAGVTRTISTAIIAIELTGQTHHLVPAFLAVLISYAIGNAITLPFYEVIMSIKGIPFLPKVRPEHYHTPVSSIMRTNLTLLSLSATYGDALDTLYGNDYMGIPWIDSSENDTFLGVVSRASLEEHIVSFVANLRERGYGDAPPPMLPSVSAHHVEDEVGSDASGEGTELVPLVRPSRAATAQPSLSDPLSDPLSGPPAMATMAAFDWEPASRAEPEARSSPGRPHNSGSDTDADADADAYVAFDDLDSFDIHTASPAAAAGGGGGGAAAAAARRRAQSIPHTRSRSVSEWGTEPLVQSSMRVAVIDAQVNDSIRTILDATPFPFTDLSVVVDDAPFTISPTTTLQRAEFIFKMAGLSHCWVTHRGRLVGVVTKKDFIAQHGHA